MVNTDCKSSASGEGNNTSNNVWQSSIYKFKNDSLKDKE